MVDSKLFIKARIELTISTSFFFHMKRFRYNSLCLQIYLYDYTNRAYQQETSSQRRIKDHDLMQTGVNHKHCNKPLRMELLR